MEGFGYTAPEKQEMGSGCQATQLGPACSALKRADIPSNLDERRAPVSRTLKTIHMCLLQPPNEEAGPGKGKEKDLKKRTESP